MNGKAYYNEHSPRAAKWLENLIAAGAICPGDVDTRSIKEVKADEVAGYTQCHFFAGIGLWSLALRQAGWPDDRPVWTGSCPCQPFSRAGRKEGFKDPRHLWPTFHRLIGEHRPAVVFGEQVTGPDADDWFDLVQDGLEKMDYAFGIVPFAAAGLASPQIRERAYWVGNAASGEERRSWRRASGEGRQDRGHGGSELLADAWRHFDLVHCTDGRSRPVEPGAQPMAHGGAAAVVQMRAYGNGLCVPAARAFVEAFLEAA